MSDLSKSASPSEPRPVDYRIFAKKLSDMLKGAGADVHPSKLEMWLERDYPNGISQAAEPRRDERKTPESDEGRKGLPFLCPHNVNWPHDCEHVEVPQGHCQLASHVGLHAYTKECFNWWVIARPAALPEGAEPPPSDVIKQAEIWLLRTENDLGQEREHREVSGLKCGDGVTDVRCELCRLSIMLSAYSKWQAERGSAVAPGMSELRELLCQKCGRDYPIWFAPNELWNKVVQNVGDILCMDCFGLLAESRGVKPTAWMVTEENVELSQALEENRRLKLGLPLGHVTDSLIDRAAAPVEVPRDQDFKNKFVGVWPKEDCERCITGRGRHTCERAASGNSSKGEGNGTRS